MSYSIEMTILLIVAKETWCEGKREETRPVGKAGATDAPTPPSPHRLQRSAFLLTNDLGSLRLAHYRKIMMISGAAHHGLLKQTR